MPATPDYLTRITMDARVCRAQPVVRGLAHHLVADLLDLLASGMTEAEILADYEDLEPADFRVCQTYAAEAL